MDDDRPGRRQLIETVDRNLGGHLLTIAQRAIFVPDQTDLQPDREKLEWHREKIYIA
jgi:hypothetical protein